MRSAFNRLLLVASLVLAFSPGVALAWGGVHNLPQNLSVQTIAVSGAVTSTKTCATGYSRVSPNYCHKDSLSSTFFTRDVCTDVSISGVTPSYIDIQFVMYAATGNVAATVRSTNVQDYTTSGCSVALTILAQAAGYEFTATAAGTYVGSSVTNWSHAVTQSGHLYLKMADDAGNSGVGSYLLVGYWD